MKKIVVYIPEDEEKNKSFESFLQAQELTHEDYQNIALDKVVHKKDFKIRLTAVVSLAVMLLIAGLAFWQMNETEHYKKQWLQSLDTIEQQKQSLHKVRDSLFKREKEFLDLQKVEANDSTAQQNND
ncbi:MAG: hypothetical protein JJT94_14030 [Bernardetiaceae bacterium]|nr:hypothetical protein [Bernardetiaceae bacterium]